MIKKYIVALLSLVCAITAMAEKTISIKFIDTPLPTALKTIEQLAEDDITINFSYRKLEDYTVTAEIIDATPIEAVEQAIGFYPIKISYKGRIVTVQPVLDTEYKIRGRLIDERGEGVDFATVALLSLPDSAIIISGVSNMRGDFVLPVTAAAPMALIASRIGYVTTATTVAAGDIGDVRIQTDPQMLKTLTAYADRNVISTVGAVTNIRIEGTPYSQIGTLADLLPNLPGFALPQSQIGAYGMGGIVYCINGREVSETAQLNTLRTDEVRSISIDKAPGAEYPANTAVVVNISTIKSANDFINLQLSNTMQIRQKFSDMPNVDFKMQLGKFTTALNYQHDFLQEKVEESVYRVVEQNGVKSVLLSICEGNGKNDGPRLNWSNELQLNTRNRLGLYFYLYSLSNKVEEAGTTQSMDYGEYELTRYLQGHSNLYSGTLSYDYAGNKFSAHIAQDIAYTDPYSNLRVNEYHAQSPTVRFDANNHEYFVATTNARFQMNLGPQTFLNFGGRYSYIESNSSKNFWDGIDPLNDFAASSWISHNRMNVNETSKQAYLLLSQRVGNITLVPGVRYEHLDRWISDEMHLPNGGNAYTGEPIRKIYDRKYSHWLPSLVLKYSNRDFRTVFNYECRMVQPTFSMLNSGLVYEDNFTYYLSNYQLKPSLINNFRLSFGYRGLTADVSYYRAKNTIAEVEKTYATVVWEDVPNASDVLISASESAIMNGAVYRTPINLRNYHEIDFNLAYASSIGALGYYAAANLVIPGWHTIAYSNQKATFNAEINLTYKFNDKFSLYTNLKHFGSCRWLVYDRIDSQIWNVGFNASLLHNRLNINLEGTDLLGRNHMNFVSTMYENVSSSRSVGSDSRGVRIRIAYTLFNKPIRTNVKRGNVDDIDRIER